MAKKKPSSSSWIAHQIKDPRWLRKRLEVFQAHNFTCEQCGFADQTLHAHHKRYIWGNDYWDYDLDDLACLCEECHGYISAADTVLKGNHKRKDVKDAAYNFKYLLGLLMSDLKETEIADAVSYLSSATSDIAPPERFERDMHTRPLADMIELILQDSIEARRARRLKGVEK
jgi:hypothetical protein